jgi:hypothetical protein
MAMTPLCLSRGSSIKVAVHAGGQQSDASSVTLGDLEQAVSTQAIAEAALPEGLHMHSVDWSVLVLRLVGGASQVCVAVGGTKSDSSSARNATTRAFIALMPSNFDVSRVMDDLCYLLAAQQFLGSARDSAADVDCALLLMHAVAPELLYGEQDDCGGTVIENPGMCRARPLCGFGQLEARFKFWEKALQPCQTVQRCAAAREVAIATRYTGDTGYPLWNFPSFQSSFASMGLLLTSIGGPQALAAVWTALLRGQRVMFVTAPSQQVNTLVQTVWAATLLLGPLVSFKGVCSRCAPLVSLADTSWTERKGLIGGTNNPLILLKQNWWDVCIDIDSNRLLLADVPTEPLPDLSPEIKSLLQSAAKTIFSRASHDEYSLQQDIARFMAPVALYLRPIASTQRDFTSYPSTNSSAASSEHHRVSSTDHCKHISSAALSSVLLVLQQGWRDATTLLPLLRDLLLSINAVRAVTGKRSSDTQNRVSKIVQLRLSNALLALTFHADLRVQEIAAEARSQLRTPEVCRPARERTGSHLFSLLAASN